MKQGQIEQLGIIVLIIMLVILTLFKTMGESALKVVRTQELITRYKLNEIPLGLSSFLYASVEGVSSEELLGVLVCYTQPFAAYDIRAPINIVQGLRTNLQEIYGERDWLLSFSYKVDDHCVTKTQYYFPCSNSTKLALLKDIQQGDVTTYGFVFPLPCRAGQHAKGMLYVQP